MLVVLIGGSTLLSGCIYSREISRTRRDIERSNVGVDYGRGMSLSLGPVSLKLARWILRRVDDEDALEASGYLSDVRRVKAGVYRARDGWEGDFSELPTLKRFEKRGWELAVRVREKDEGVLVYYRENRASVSDMFVVVASQDELVLAKIEGRLNRLLERAMSDERALRDLTDLSFD